MSKEAELEDATMRIYQKPLPMNPSRYGFLIDIHRSGFRFPKSRSLMSALAVCTTLYLYMDSAAAHVPQDGAIHVVVGPLSYATHEIGQGRMSEFVNGFGISAEADLDKNGGLEVSILYNPKVFRIETNGLVLEETSKRIHIVTGYRHWFSPWFSFGGGIFSSYSMGDTYIRRNDFSPGPSPSTRSRSPSNYGIDLSTQAEFWRSPNGKLGFVVDIRYSLALSKNENESSNHYGALIGAKYSIQAGNDSASKTKIP
jgi:hypothetical protein